MGFQGLLNNGEKKCLNFTQRHMCMHKHVLKAFGSDLQNGQYQIFQSNLDLYDALGHCHTLNICALFPCSCSVGICSGRHQTPKIHVLLDPQKGSVMKQIMTDFPLMQCC